MLESDVTPYVSHKDIPHHDDSTGLVGEQVQGSSTTLVNRTVISRIKEIVERRDEFSLTDYLRGEAAQTFVDVVHEVRLIFLYFQGLDRLQLLLHFQTYPIRL